MQALKASHGEQQLRRLMAFMRQPTPYPVIRRGEPLLRALDPYLGYLKGPFAMYALSEYMGAERVNAAVRRFVEKYPPASAPLATTWMNGCRSGSSRGESPVTSWARRCTCGCTASAPGGRRSR